MLLEPEATAWLLSKHLWTDPSFSLSHVFLSSLSFLFLLIEGVTKDGGTR